MTDTSATKGGSPLPPNIPGEDEPPDVRLAVLVASTLLRDLCDHLALDDEDELGLRIVAVLAVLHRVKENLDDSQ